MISFYPGPSRVHDDIPRWTAEAARKGILSMNHRSPEFMKLVEETVSLLRKKLRVPKSYTVFFVSSATECWEIIAQSLIREGSTHVYNGAFGEKWFSYTKRLRPATQGIVFDMQEALPKELLTHTLPELICITQNETSNGTAVAPAIISALQKKYHEALIAVDATSSMAGIDLDFSKADIWFASVQKCFGLPAGLALLICSPRSLEHARQLNERLHYNSLTFMAEMMSRWQTTHTPNVLGIYLLNKALAAMKSIRDIDKETTLRARAWFAFLKAHTSLQPLIRKSTVRSKTVITLEGDPAFIQKLKHLALKRGLLLGDGYGEYKQNTIRIANFPAITNQEIDRLKRFLKVF